MTIPPEKLDRLRSGSEQYLQYRRARARVSEVFKQILKLLDQIEKLRREKRGGGTAPKSNTRGCFFCAIVCWGSARIPLGAFIILTVRPPCLRRGSFAP